MKKLILTATLAVSSLSATQLLGNGSQLYTVDSPMVMDEGGEIRGHLSQVYGPWDIVVAITNGPIENEAWKYWNIPVYVPPVINTPHPVKLPQVVELTPAPEFHPGTPSCDKPGDPAAVPEPGTVAMFSLAAVLVGVGKFYNRLTRT